MCDEQKQPPSVLLCDSCEKAITTDDGEKPFYVFHTECQEAIANRLLSLFNENTILRKQVQSLLLGGARSKLIH